MRLDTRLVLEQRGQKAQDDALRCSSIIDVEEDPVKPQNGGRWNE